MVTHGWFVCPTVSMVTTSHATGLEKNLFTLGFTLGMSKISKIRNSPFYRGVDLWNTLKVQHHRAENKKRFKMLLKPPD